MFSCHLLYSLSAGKWLDDTLQGKILDVLIRVRDKYPQAV